MNKTNIPKICKIIRLKWKTHTLQALEAFNITIKKTISWYYNYINNFNNRIKLKCMINILIS